MMNCALGVGLKRSGTIDDSRVPGDEKLEEFLEQMQTALEKTDLATFSKASWDAWQYICNHYFSTDSQNDFDSLKRAEQIKARYFALYMQRERFGEKEISVG
jgi:hypothetical protein